MRRASRGRLVRPVSWREVRGMMGFGGAMGVGCEAVAAGEGGLPLVPFVWGASPLASAILMRVWQRFGRFDRIVRLQVMGWERCSRACRNRSFDLS